MTQSPGQRLRELRGERTQHEIAQAVGVRAASISLWESGAATPSRKNAKAYDEALGANGEVLAMFGYSEGPDPFTTMQSKLDEILAIVRRLDRGDRRGGRHSVDPTPAETPRPALRRR